MADLASMVISLGPLGIRPWRRVKSPARAALPPTLEARVGAPPGWIGAPALSSRSAKPVTEPSATSTPSIAATVPTRASGIGRASDWKL